MKNQPHHHYFQMDCSIPGRNRVIVFPLKTHRQGQSIFNDSGLGTTWVRAEMRVYPQITRRQALKLVGRKNLEKAETAVNAL